MMGSHVAESTITSLLPDATEVESRVLSTGLAAERHHHAGVCHYCLALPPNPTLDPLTPPLMRCSQCHLVMYCSKKCQKKDWPKHRDFCRANKVEEGRNVFSRAKAALAAGDTTWDDYRTSVCVAASVNLKRPLRVYEREVLLYPRVCEVCRESNPERLATCPCCHSVFYCSPQHRDVDEKRHIRYCTHYLLLLECERIEARNGIQDLPFPVQVDEAFRNLPDKLMTLVRPQLEENVASLLDPKVVTMITERLSYPLSLLYALQNVGIGSENTALHEIEDLRIHVVGATSYTELLGIIRWEYMAHRLPALRRLHVVFIGPELFSCQDEDIVTDNHILDDSGLTMCEICQDKQRRIVYEMANMCYHEFVSTQEHYSEPDVIVAYNCGFHENSTETLEEQKAEDTWRRSLPLLVRRPHTPLVFTSYTADEAAQDLAALSKSAPVKVLMPPQVNPFQSLRPYRQHEAASPEPIHFWNQYICCVIGDSQ